MVKAVFPTPPSPSTTSLYSTILPAMIEIAVVRTCQRSTKVVNRSPNRRGRQSSKELVEGVVLHYLKGSPWLKVENLFWAWTLARSSDFRDRRISGATIV